jgi:hypothetical protein
MRVSQMIGSLGSGSPDCNQLQAEHPTITQERSATGIEYAAINAGGPFKRGFGYHE